MSTVQCFKCGENNVQWQCAGCSKAFYCNTTCQELHWTAHKIQCTQTQFTLLSFNVVADTPRTNVGSLSSWPTRRPLILHVLQNVLPTVCGFQEIMYNQLKDIAAGLPDYYAHTDSDWFKTHESAFLPVFYDTRTVRLQDSGHFWMSDTPNVPDSRWSRSSWPYMCVWARFSIGSHTFRVYNLHLDVDVPEYRLSGIGLILNHIKQYSIDEPVFIMGDFNSRIQDFPANAARAVGFIDTHRAYQHAGESDKYVDHHPTQHGTALISLPMNRIDHILYRTGGNQSVSLKSTDTIQFHQGGFYPSDHYPIRATVVLACE